MALCFVPESAMQANRRDYLDAVASLDKGARRSSLGPVGRDLLRVSSVTEISVLQDSGPAAARDAARALKRGMPAAAGTGASAVEAREDLWP